MSSESENIDCTPPEIRKEAQNVYDTLLSEKSKDPRSKHLPLMSSPMPSLVIVAVYLVLVTKIGPKFMENRKAYELKNVLIVYNAIQVVLSAYIFYMNITAGFTTHYSLFKCNDVDFSTTNPQALIGMYAVYFYFLSKFTEFFDTIFFVLRKKQNQITFLHLFHHSQVPLFSWLAAKFIPGGSITLGMGLNSLVHVVMYSYYLLAGLGPHMQKYLWWKKYLTSMQLLQFMVAMVHTVFIVFGDCKTLYKPYVIAGFIYILALYLLFKKFYNTSYTKEEENIKKDD